MGFEIQNGVLKKYREEPRVTEVVIPHGVTSIGKNAFAECKSLISVTIPNHVTTIGAQAFSGCSSLISVTIADSVTNIGTEAFAWCNKLLSVTIPDSVTSIGYKAFYACVNLPFITIFGYQMYTADPYWDKVQPSEVLYMLIHKDYSVKMDYLVKFPIVARVFLKDSQPEAEAYLKKNISKIMPYFIHADDYEIVRGLLNSGKFVTERNIMKFIDCAIAHTQSGGDMQIQVLLMNYKNEHFPDEDPMKTFKL